MSDGEQRDLFAEDEPNRPDFGPAGPGAGARPVSAQPLAARMRPRTLAEMVGQEHILQPGALLPRLVATNRFGSLIFYGPPGSGKTSLAEAIAWETKSRFVRINAVMSNVAELRDMLAAARRRPEAATILFIDELHRFNKSQQDLLLPDVEEGSVRLIGATTHNPGFYVNPTLLSRSHLFRLDPLTPAQVVAVLKRALADRSGASGAAAAPRRTRCCSTWPTSVTAICAGRSMRWRSSSWACPRRPGSPPRELEIFARERRIRYDADEDEHYDTISAFIKSCRGGDPDAAMYWLAKMLAGGEDPRFIARRLVILASEDIGLADPAGPAAGGGGAPRDRFHRPARGGAHPGPCHALHRHRAEEQFGDPGIGRGEGGIDRAAGPVGAGAFAGQGRPGVKAHGSWRGLPLQPRVSGGDFGTGIPAEAARALFAEAGRRRGRHRRAPERWKQLKADLQKRNR